MSTEASAELQAPPGTYEYLHGLLGRKLGNSWTKRNVSLYEAPPGVYFRSHTEERALTVNLTIRDFRSDGMKHYYLALSRDDKVLALGANKFETRASRPQGVPPPTLAELLKEVRAAERLQPKLKI